MCITISSKYTLNKLIIFRKIETKEIRKTGKTIFAFCTIFGVLTGCKMPDNFEIFKMPAFIGAGISEERNFKNTESTKYVGVRRFY